jgi:hypothetical protein
LDDLEKALEGKSESEQHKLLNFELRFRKFSLQTMKESCALFRQHNLSIDQKKDNVCLLIKASKLSHNSSSTMKDLESAIRSFAPLSHSNTIESSNETTASNTASVIETNVLVESQIPSVIENDKQNELACEQDTIARSPLQEQDNLIDNGFWPPPVGSNVVALFDDGFYPGEVLSLNMEKEEVKVTFMQLSRDNT